MSPKASPETSRQTQLKIGTHDTPDRTSSFVKTAASEPCENTDNHISSGALQVQNVFREDCSLVNSSLAEQGSLRRGLFSAGGLEQTASHEEFL